MLVDIEAESLDLGNLSQSQWAICSMSCH
jgi:hypothetical protein